MSIPSNMAEGQHRGSIKEFVYFLHISYGSCAELETQLLIAYRLHYITDKDNERIVGFVSEIVKMLYALIVKLKTD